MKKLLFATALVASAAAFADPINAISFEGYTADSNVTVGNKADTPDVSGGNNAAYFYYDGDQDGSTVKAYGVGDNLVAPATHTAYFAQLLGQNNAKYLDLSTEGGVLWRAINTISSSTSGETTTYGLGNSTNVAAGGLYLDTLVQFTPTEDGGTPELTADDKLAIWLNVSENVTNLMVRAKYWYMDGDEPVGVATNFAVSGVSVQPGTWYRLTVKAIQATTTYSGAYIPAFQIFIDGNSVAAAEPQYEADLQTGFATIWAAGMQELAAANKLFPSLAGNPANLAAVTLTAVGFKGSGALDDIVWTEEDPFAGAPQPEGYVVDLGGNNVPITLTDAQLAAMALAGVDTNSVAAVNAALDTEIGGEGTTGVKAWEAAILGLEPTVAGLQEFKIDSVTIGADGKVTVEMADGVTLATGQGIDITLKVIGSDDLTTWDTANPLATVTNSLTIPAMTPAQNETKKFYKVVVQFAATPAQN